MHQPDRPGLTHIKNRQHHWCRYTCAVTMTQKRVVCNDRRPLSGHGNGIILHEGVYMKLVILNFAHHLPQHGFHGFPALADIGKRPGAAASVRVHQLGDIIQVLIAGDGAHDAAVGAASVKDHLTAAGQPEGIGPADEGTDRVDVALSVSGLKTAGSVCFFPQLEQPSILKGQVIIIALVFVDIDIFFLVLLIQFTIERERVDILFQEPGNPLRIFQCQKLRMGLPAAIKSLFRAFKTII